MTHDTEALRGLLAKVEAATRPDRRLDYEIFVAFAELNRADLWDPKVGHFYTASVDAAHALARRVVPGLDLRADKAAPTLPLAILGSLLCAALTQRANHEG